MGHPARRLDDAVRGAGRDRGARLRLVRQSTTPPQAASARAEAACTSTFRLVVLALVALAVLGLARVTLSARVAEASIDSTRLRKTIKAETLVADSLEIDKSLLVTPSRIESIAAGELKMTKAAPVRYLRMPESSFSPAARSGAGPLPDVGRTAGSRTGPMALLMGAALDVTGKEARALLVGDVGLANTR